MAPHDINTDLCNAMHVATCIEKGDRDEDRLAIRRTPTGVVVVVADGAGGVGGGAVAAQCVCDFVCGRPLEAGRSPEDWVSTLQAADRLMTTSREGGLTTVVVLEISGTVVFGASVGDSGAWMIGPKGIVDLTNQQLRKPLLGNGEALPVVFGPNFVDGRLLIATDGLLKYAPRTELAKRALARSVDDAVAALVDSVRLRSGALQDDVAVVLLELAG
jgi:serine/threonine protein phosphatase PrpC